MNFIKTIAICFTLLFGIVVLSNAQKIGINAGTNLTSMMVEDNDGKDKDINPFWPRMRVGGNLLIPLKNSDFFVNTGLIYSQKGYHKTVEQEGDLLLDATFKINYIDVPVNFGAKLGNNQNFMLIGGPFLGYGVGKAKGKMDYWEPQDYLDSESEYEFGHAGLQHFNFGVQAGLGFDFQYFQIVAKYSYGLTNIFGSERTSGFDKWINKTRVLSVSVRKFFD
jgi:hypothetical protein